MAPIPLVFPTSSIPGKRPQEGRGRLINVSAEDVGDKTIIHRPVPGLRQLYDTAQNDQRGFIDVGGTLYGAYLDKGYTLTAGGTLTILTGSLLGAGPVTWARNNQAGTPDLVAVDYDNGAFTVTAAAVTAFADVDLPQANSVSFLGGYFLFTLGSGKIYASGLNAVTVDALSFTTAESNPDGLTRGVVSGEQFYAFGPSSCEVYVNVGTSPFPLARQAVIPVGLIGPWAVAGFGAGWDLAPIFVAQDSTVRTLRGYDPIIISKPDVVRDIQAVVDKNTIKATVFVSGDHACCAISSDTWTWVYDASTTEWHERESFGQTRWRGEHAIKFNGLWMVADTESGKLFEISEDVYKEGDNALVKVWESGPVAQYPFRLEGTAVYFNFTVGQGSSVGGEPIETDPVVSIYISRDGGNTWGNPLIRKLGPQGIYTQQVRVNRLGLSTQHGLRFRLVVSDPVHVALQSGVIDITSARMAA